MEVVLDRPNRQGAAECLVPGLVLRRAELGLAQRPLQAREEVRDGLGVIPDVRAGAVAAARVVAAAFPAPQPAVGLAHHRRRLQDRQVRGHRFDDLGRQGGVVEAIAEAAGLLPQFVVMVAPVERHAVDVREPPGIPRAVFAGLVRLGLEAREVFADAQVGLPDKPRQPQHDGLRCAGAQAGRAQTRSRRGWGRPRSAAHGHSTRLRPRLSRPWSARPTSRRGTRHDSPSRPARTPSRRTPPRPTDCPSTRRPTG